MILTVLYGYVVSGNDPPNRTHDTKQLSFKSLLQGIHNRIYIYIYIYRSKFSSYSQPLIWKMETQEALPHPIFCLVGSCCCCRCSSYSIRLVQTTWQSFQLLLRFHSPTFFLIQPTPTSSLHLEFIVESYVFWSNFHLFALVATKLE